MLDAHTDGVAHAAPLVFGVPVRDGIGFCDIVVIAIGIAESLAQCDDDAVAHANRVRDAVAHANRVSNAITHAIRVVDANGDADAAGNPVDNALGHGVADDVAHGDADGVTDVESDTDGHAHAHAADTRDDASGHSDEDRDSHIVAHAVERRHAIAHALGGLDAHPHVAADGVHEFMAHSHVVAVRRIDTCQHGNRRTIIVVDNERLTDNDIVCDETVDAVGICCLDGN